MKQLRFIPSRCAIALLCSALFSFGHAQETPAKSKEPAAPSKAAKSERPPSFLVLPVDTDTPDITLPISKNDSRSRPSSATNTGQSTPEARPEPGPTSGTSSDRVVHDTNASTSPYPTKNTSSSAPGAAPAAEPPRPERIAIEHAIGNIDSTAPFQNPTLLLFLCGHHLELVPSPGTRGKKLSEDPKKGDFPAIDKPENAEAKSDADAVTPPANRSAPAERARPQPVIRGLVKIGMPPAGEIAGTTVDDGLPSIVIYDHQGNMHDFTDQLKEGVELRILVDILTSIPDPSVALSPGAVRDIFNLVSAVTGHSLLNANAARLARALDQAILVKENLGADGAVVYINGQPSQAFFDDLNASNLDIPITTYFGKEGFEDAPEGYSKLAHYPATAVIWDEQRIAATIHFTEQDLVEFETGGKVKELLVAFLRMFPEKPIPEKNSEREKRQ